MSDFWLVRKICHNNAYLHIMHFIIYTQFDLHEMREFCIFLWREVSLLQI